MRPPFVAIAAMLVWFGAAALVLGLLTLAHGRVRGLTVALVALGALGPFAMARWMPGVAQPPGTPSSDDESWFGWSPEGQILFLSDRSDTGGRFVYFMDADGSDVRLALRI